MEKVLEVNNLSVKLNQFSLKNVSFNLEKGTIMGFIGQNGSGKTTTLRIIINALGKDSGEVKVLGKDNIEEEIFMKNRIGYVPAEDYLIDNQTLERHAKTFEYFYDTWDAEIFKTYTKKWKLDLYEKAGNFSTGMKTKAMIALTLAHNPTILILDEPTAGLDPVARMELLDELRTFVDDGEKSILISTHITSDLDKIADYVTLINDGEILESMSMDKIQENYIIVKGDLELLEETEEKFVGIRKWNDSFEGLILRENLTDRLKELKGISPNIESLLTYYIWGNR